MIENTVQEELTATPVIFGETQIGPASVEV